MLWEPAFRVVDDVGPPAKALESEILTRLVDGVEDGRAVLEWAPQFIGKGAGHSDSRQLDFHGLIDARDADFLDVQES